ncbi:MAG: LuxR C-terminal-related transcriptional regulator [Methylobacter sp.]
MDQIAEGVDLNSILANAPGNPFIWNRFLTELVRQLDCDSSALLVTDLIEKEKTHFLFSAHIPVEYQEQYQNTLNRLDGFNYFISKTPLQVFCNQTLADIYTEELESDFIPPCGQGFRFGVSIPCNHNYSLSLLINRKAAFDDGELQRVTQILQSIISALNEAVHAEQRHKINSQMIHFIDGHFDGYIIVDHELNILFSDPVYTSIISQLDCVNISENRFGMTPPAIEQRLLSLIENNEQASFAHDPCHSCRITLTPISSLKNLYQWECYKDGFILTFTHDKDNNPAIDRLIEIYHLSRCEAVCALHFMKNPSISDIAANTFRSQETVRNHIKHTMQKMDVHSQAELMKKLITLAAL